MSAEHSKMVLFGKWLTLQVRDYQAALNGACSDYKVKDALIRIKYGNLEAFGQCLSVFSELFEGDTDKWIKSYLAELEMTEKGEKEDDQ